MLTFTELLVARTVCTAGCQYGATSQQVEGRVRAVFLSWEDEWNLVLLAACTLCTIVIVLAKGCHFIFFQQGHVSANLGDNKPFLLVLSRLYLVAELLRGCKDDENLFDLATQVEDHHLEFIFAVNLRVDLSFVFYLATISLL